MIFNGLADFFSERYVALIVSGKSFNSPPHERADDWPGFVLQVLFSKPVIDLTFSLGDIDDVRNVSPYDGWRDVVIVSGFDGATMQPGTTAGFGPTVAPDTNGNLYAPIGSNAISLFGFRSANSVTTEGNVNVSFAGPVTRLRIDYRPGLPMGAVSDGILGFGPSDTTSQHIALHDMTFSAVPEPSSFLLLGLILGAAGAIRCVTGLRTRLLPRENPSLGPWDQLDLTA